MIVVKIGGSLYTHPGLATGLRAYLSTLTPPVVLVPGGGPFADAVRTLDRIHQLGDKTAHWVVLRALSAATLFLRAMVADMPDVYVLDAYELLSADDTLPHSWRITTDSIAAHVARRSGAPLILLKSVDIPPGTDWQAAADAGWVDTQFPVLAAGLTVKTVNFRSTLDRP